MEIKDEGIGIEDLEMARSPSIRVNPKLDRSGMGFTIMENFMDEVKVYSAPGKGTTVVLVKIRSKKELPQLESMNDEYLRALILRYREETGQQGRSWPG